MTETTHRIELDLGEDVEIAGANLRITNLSRTGITVESVDRTRPGDPQPPPTEPPPDPEPEPVPTGENWVPNWLLQDDLFTPNPEPWQDENGYFYNPEIQPNGGGMHGPLCSAFKPGVRYESPTCTWYWQADRDGVPVDTWPEGVARDRVWVDFPAGEYAPGDTLVFGFEEAGHIHEQPGSVYDGSCKVTLYADGVPFLEIIGQQSAFGAGHRSPPETVRREFQPDKVYRTFRIEVEAELRGENAGILWGAFWLGKS